MFSVLYVDDETGLLDIGKIFLESLGQFSIETVTSAQNALTLMNERCFDAIISDYQMPDMNGIEFLRRVRTSGNDIPFILFTGRGREEIAIQALNEGADFYLQKGGDPSSQFTELAYKIRQAITRRSTELALKESEKRLSEIINFLPDATFAIDRSGRVIAWNRAMEELTHIPSADMLGKDDHEYAVPFYGLRRKMLADLILEPEEAFMENYSYVQTDEDFLIAETTLSRMEGRPVALMGKASPLYDQKGEIVGAIESIRDITARVRAEDELRAANERITASEEKLREQYDELLRREKELRESKERLQMFMDSASDAFTIWDPNLNLIDLNQNALAYLSEGTRKEDVIGKNYVELLPEAFARGEHHRLLEVRRTGVPFIGIEKMPERQFGTHWYNLKVFKVGDGLGIATNDITQMKMVEDKLKAANEQLTLDKEELKMNCRELGASQAALRMSEERFRAFTERVADLTAITDRNRVQTYVSPSVLRLMGLDAEKVLGTICTSDDNPLSIHPEDFHKIISCSEQAMHETGKSVNIPIFKCLDREGRTMHIEGSFVYLPDLPGIQGLLFHGRDVTDRILIEEAAKESEARYRNVIESSPYGMHFYELRPDRSLVFTGANPSADMILRMGHDHLIGKTIESAFPPLAGTEVPEQYRKVAESGGIWQSEHMVYQGESVSGLFSITAFQTSPGSMATMFVDITDRKRTEDALHRSESKYRTIIDNLLDLVFEADMDGNFTMVSPSGARLLGFSSPAEMIGLPVSSIYENPNDVYAFMKALSNTGTLSGYQMVLRSRNGDLRYVLMNSRFTYDEGGVLKGVEGVMHDVTELRRVEDALRMANKKLTLLSGITRHDIKNQLMVLDGYIHISRSVPNATEKMKEIIEKEQRASETISRQIDFTKDYEELGVRSAVWQDVSALARNAGAALPMNDIKLVIQGRGLEVFADPLVEKVFYNLMDNSLRHGGSKVTAISISMIDHAGDLEIVYQDDGEGIAAADKGRLFLKGFGKNTGLGLFLSKEILSITGITINENGEPGKGARFEIKVPKGVWRSVSRG